jgi:diguanylate cyclase (GGDEF)-like protein
MIVEDALADDRFANNPLVTSEPQIRFYAGAPLVTHGRFALGTISVMDREPRDLTADQTKGLEALARQISLRLELRQTSRQLQRANEELKEMSLRDELTGLYNRRGFLLHAEQQLKLFRSRESDRSLWMMLADMDGLKVINDTYGHAEGSLAIKAVADILRKTFRDADILARPGGDEFTALLLNTLDEVAERLPERLRLNFADHNAESGKPYKVEISIGLIKVGFEEGTSVRDLIQQADIEMYKDKARRRAGRK